jgi:hypothetical protein
MERLSMTACAPSSLVVVSTGARNGPGKQVVRSPQWSIPPELWQAVELGTGT